MSTAAKVEVEAEALGDVHAVTQSGTLPHCGYLRVGGAYNTCPYQASYLTSRKQLHHFLMGWIIAC